MHKYFYLLLILLFFSIPLFAQEEGLPLSSESLMNEDFVINPALQDAYIQRTLQNKFDADPLLSKVYVSSQNGVVTLDGNDNSELQMDYAETIASQMPAVKAVDRDVDAFSQ